MNNLSRALAVALMAATVPATIVLAQQAPSEQPNAEHGKKQRGPSAETISRLEDGRIAMAKAALKLTPEQEKLWAPVEEKIRARFEDTRKEREAWQAKLDERRADRKAKGEDGKRERQALPERIEARSERLTKMAQRLTERAAKTKEFAETLKPLYASFSDEQKAVAGKALGHFVGGKRGHGQGWAMHRGFGKEHGYRGYGPGPQSYGADGAED